MIRRVLKHIEGIHARGLQVAGHAPGPHGLGDVLGAGTVMGQAEGGVEGRVACHEGHVVGVCGVVGEAEEGGLLWWG